VTTVSDPVMVYCYIPGTAPWGGVWTLVLDLYNDQVGFMDDSFLTDPGKGLDTFMIQC